MNHWNDNALCAIAIQTTGKTVGKDDLIQLTIAPIDHKLDFEETPFFANLKLMNGGFSGETHAKIIAEGIEPYQVAIALEFFVKRLVGTNKFGTPYKIIPICYDWVNIKPWLVDLLGQTLFDDCFYHYYRDLLPTTLFLNDKAAYRGNRPPFSKNTFGYINGSIKSGIDYKYDTNQACRSIRACYIHMLKQVLEV